jgi:hypothetical protein
MDLGSPGGEGEAHLGDGSVCGYHAGAWPVPQDRVSSLSFAIRVGERNLFP